MSSPRSTAPRRFRLLPPDDETGWMPYLWLVYIGFFLIEPAYRIQLNAFSPTHAAATALGLIVFLIAYFRGFWAGERELWAVVGALAGLGVTLTPLNPGASVFLIYAASFAGRLASSTVALRVVAGIAALGALVSWVTDPPPWYWFPAVAMPLVIGFVSLHSEQVRRSNAKLRLAHEQIEHLATVAERERIARDLHDLLGHTLSLIVLKSELAAKLSSRDPARAAAEIRDVEQVARKALHEVRDAIRGYRTTLAGEAAQSRAILRAAGIAQDVEVDGADVDREAEEVLALALREAVTNVVRHAGASTCRVRLRENDGAVTLAVEDDGRGAGAPEGGGLRGMRERVEALGGSVEREPGTNGRGMRLIVHLPRDPRVVQAEARVHAVAGSAR